MIDVTSKNIAQSAVDCAKKITPLVYGADACLLPYSKYDHQELHLRIWITNAKFMVGGSFLHEKDLQMQEDQFIERIIIPLAISIAYSIKKQNQ